VVVALQEPLPLRAEPFVGAATAAGMDVDRLLEVARSLHARGIMRRFAGVLRHRAAGYVANVMGVWAVPAEHVEEVGARMAAHPAVSHCYERPTFPDWPYSVFTMVHGKTREEALATLQAIAVETGVAGWSALWSLEEFKKVRLRYFTPDHTRWEAQAMAARAAAGPALPAPGHPVILRLAGRRVVVVGGGPVAERKIGALLESEARVTVVSPEVTGAIADLAAGGAIALERRPYREGDLESAMLAYAATDDPAVNRAVWEEAERRRVWLNVADRPELCHFFAPAVVRRGDLTIAVSTDGASPALARRIREDLERRLGDEPARALAALRAERERLLREEPDPARRRAILEARAAEVELP
jgi:precorrin-2 dehydrogenase/sirohydrochlorin ferrochelatase